MSWIRRLDKVRYIPVLHLATLLLFGIDSLRYAGRLKRAWNMLLTLVGCITINTVVLTLCARLPDWAILLCLFGCGYGTVLAVILSVRDEILSLNAT